jgi:hypothetical protein
VNGRLLELAELESANLIAAPNWNDRMPGRWTNYLPGDVAELWPQLSDEARLVAYICATNSAKYDYSLGA